MGVAVGLAVGVSVEVSVDVRGRFGGHVRGYFRRRICGCVRGRCRGCSVNVSVGNRGLPWYAVSAAAENAVEIAVGPAVEMSVKIAMSSAMALTVFRHMLRHSVEARAMSVKTRGVSAVVRGTQWTWPWNAVEVRGYCRGAPPKRRILQSPLFERHSKDRHILLQLHRPVLLLPP